MKLNLKKITRAGIGALIFALVLGLGLVQPAKADVEETLAVFLASCEGGTRTIISGEELEVEDGPVAVTVDNCTVALQPDAELEFGKDLTITVIGDFIITVAGASTGEREVQFGENTIINAGKIEWKLKGEEAEIQVKKNSVINSDSDIIMEVISEGVDSDDAEIQLEENIRMDAGGKIDLYAKSSGEDADDAQIQIKKVSDELLLDGNKEFALAPNITAVNDILIKAESTDEAEIQIEESNFLQSGNAIKLSGLGASGEGEVETKKFVQLVAGSDITLEVTGSEAELTIDENNVFDANSGAGTITLNAGGGELEIKSGTTFNPTPPTIIP